MSNHENNKDINTDLVGDDQVKKPIRLSVNLNDETAEALQELAKARKQSVTETVRRAVAVLHFVETELQAGNTIQIEDEQTGKVRELLLF